MNVVARLVISDETKKRGYLLSPTPAYYVKNQIDDRTFAMQEDLFKWGDSNVQTPPVPDETGQPGKTTTK
jgi:hypothetical protein